MRGRAINTQVSPWQERKMNQAVTNTTQTQKGNLEAGKNIPPADRGESAELVKNVTTGKHQVPKKGGEGNHPIVVAGGEKTWPPL